MAALWCRAGLFAILSVWCCLGQLCLLSSVFWNHILEARVLVRMVSETLAEESADALDIAVKVAAEGEERKANGLVKVIREVHPFLQQNNLLFCILVVDADHLWEVDQDRLYSHIVAEVHLTI